MSVERGSFNNLRLADDARCDAAGRWWMGSMDFGCALPTGSLYRVGADGAWARMDEGFAVTNGPTWIAQGRTMLFNDTVNGQVLAYDSDPDTGEISGRRLWLQFAPEDGVPDGMTTDALGRVWICHWGGGCVTCHDPVTAAEAGAPYRRAAQMAEAYEALVAHAEGMGANAVIAMRYEANEIMEGVTEVLAYGTAVVVEEA